MCTLCDKRKGRLQRARGTPEQVQTEAAQSSTEAALKQYISYSNLEPYPPGLTVHGCVGVNDAQSALNHCLVARCAQPRV